MCGCTTISSSIAFYNIVLFLPTQFEEKLDIHGER